MPTETTGWFQRLGIPIRDPRFWIIQGLVLLIDASHTLLEDAHLLVGDSELYLLSISVFLIPVVYAGLVFGMRGAVPTALWALVLSLPEISQHDSTTRIGILTQFAIVLAIAVIVALRVDREKAATRALQQTKENLEIYVALATEAQEEERKRLSRELHDDILQSLVVAKGQIQSAETAEQPDLVHHRLLGAQHVLEDAIVNLRRYCRALRPSLLDDLGLVDAVDWLVDDLHGRTGLAVDLETTGTPQRLSSSDELLIFRIVQEALHNVERHAHASTAHVRLAYGEQRLCMTVSDDGRGMARGPGAVPGDQPGLGLRGMDERAKLLQATLTIDSQPGRGTTLQLDVPLLHRSV